MKFSLALGMSLIFSLQSLANDDAWVAPISTYINLPSGSNTNTVEPIVTQPGGDPLSGVNDSQAFVARVLLATIDDTQVVELSLNGIDWVTATLSNGAYEYDFGVLAIGEYSLQVKTADAEMTSVEFGVTEYVPLPVSVDTLNGPSEVGVNQTFYITWDPVPGATSYNVLNYYYDGSTAELVGFFTGVTNTTYALSHNVAGNLNIRAQACNVSGCSEEEFWDVIVVKVLENVPSIPSGVNALSSIFVDETFEVTWNAVSGATSYQVYANGRSKGTVTTTSQSIALTSEGDIGIAVSACNATGCSAPSEAVNVNVTLNPNLPVTADDEGQLQVLTSRTFDVLANDYDPNASAIKIADISTLPQKGTASIAADGRSLSYENTIGACGGVDSYTDSLAYKVTNAEGLISQSATLNITILCEADGNWVALPVPFNTIAGQYNLHAGRDDYYLRANPKSWLVVGKLMVPTVGDYDFIRLFKQDNIWQTELSTLAEYSANVVSLAIPDALGQMTDLNADGWYSVNINIDLDAAPTAVDDVAVYQWNTPLEVAVLGNDSGPDPLGIEIVSIATQATLGEAVIDEARNLIVYTPNTDSCENDSFEYVIENSNLQQSTATVTLSCEPVFAQWQSSVVNVGETAYLSWNVPQAASCIISHANDDSSYSTNGANEAFVFYTPGSVTLQCLLLDGDMFEGSVLQVSESYIAPTAIDDIASYQSGTSVVIDVLSNDTALIAFGIDDPTFTQPQYGNVELDNYQLVYTPAIGSCEADSFEYTLTNSYGSATAQVNLTCSDTRWLSESVTVGQPATIVWDEPQAVSCTVTNGTTTHEFIAQSGSETLRFYSVGEALWQCLDINGQAVGTTGVSLNVDKLAKPTNLDKQATQ